MRKPVGVAEDKATQESVDAAKTSSENWAVFHEISRAAGPPKQTTKNDGPPHGSLLKAFLQLPGLGSCILPGMYNPWYMYCRRYKSESGCRKTPAPQKIRLIFFRTEKGTEPVREWLKELPQAERQAAGKDLLRAQWRWPVGMPLCRPMGNGLWEIRTDLPTKRAARVMLCLYREHLWPCTDSSRRRVQQRMRIWHWHASARRS